MKPLTLDIARAVRALRDRLDTIDEQIAALCTDIPGDPGEFRWPREIADDLDALHDERAVAETQLALLERVRKQVA